MKEKANMKSKIIVTGGGSGGHVSCASAIIEELATRYNLTEENFLYIGGDLGMEGESKSESLEKRYFNNKQFNQKYIRAGKLQRKISLQTIKLLLRTILGIIDLSPTAFAVKSATSTFTPAASSNSLDRKSVV